MHTTTTSSGTDAPTTAEPVTLHHLRKGEVDLGKGFKLSAIMRGRRITALKFTHPIKDGGECTKILPLRSSGLWNKRSYSTNGFAWFLKEEKDKSITLWPSVVCYEHSVHGWINWGEWNSTLDKLLDLPPNTLKELLKIAMAEAEEFGGGYQGALYALADRNRPKYRR